MKSSQELTSKIAAKVKAELFVFKANTLEFFFFNGSNIFFNGGGGGGGSAGA